MIMSRFCGCKPVAGSGVVSSSITCQKCHFDICVTHLLQPSEATYHHLALSERKMAHRVICTYQLEISLKSHRYFDEISKKSDEIWLPAVVVLSESLPFWNRKRRWFRSVAKDEFGLLFFSIPDIIR
jgi:hypothetical protein